MLDIKRVAAHKMYMYLRCHDQQAHASALIIVTYVVQGMNKGRDMSIIECYN